MNKKIITVCDIKIGKRKVHHFKNPIFLED